VQGPPNRGPQHQGNGMRAGQKIRSDIVHAGKIFHAAWQYLPPAFARRDSGPVFFRSAKNLPTELKRVVKGFRIPRNLVRSLAVAR